MGADCRFTLYHGYKLTSLTDGAGDPLDYKREGDYLTVYPPAGERLEELVFQYRGEGGLSYSNRQAVFLPAGFGYYPLEGWVPLYEENEVPFAAVGAEKDFTLQVSASCPLEVSLPPAEKGYAGRTQGVTLLGGLVTRGDCGGMELVSASLSHRMGNIFWDEYQSRLDAAAQLDGELSTSAGQLLDLYYNAKDAAADLIGRLDAYETNDAELDEIEQRIDLIYKLKRKYGDTVEDIIAFGQKAREELELIQSSQERVCGQGSGKDGGLFPVVAATQYVDLTCTPTMDLRYNDLMDRMDRLEEEGRIFVLRPGRPVDVGRFEGDTKKLLALINEGREDARAALPALREYLAAKH